MAGSRAHRPSPVQARPAMTSISRSWSDKALAVVNDAGTRRRRSDLKDGLAILAATGDRPSEPRKDGEELRLVDNRASDLYRKRRVTLAHFVSSGLREPRMSEAGSQIRPMLPWPKVGPALSLTLPTACQLR